jgi:hypothetical protein
LVVKALILLLFKLEVVDISGAFLIATPCGDLLFGFAEQESALSQPTQQNHNATLTRNIDRCSFFQKLNVPHCEDDSTAEKRQNQALLTERLKSGFK